MKAPRNVTDTKKFADDYFKFLITDHGFICMPEYYISYEYHFGYRKEDIEIHFVCEADGTSLPLVTLRDHRNLQPAKEKKQPEYYYLTQAETTELLHKIFADRSERYFPKVEHLIASLDSEAEYEEAQKALETDYEEEGVKEVELVIKEYAEIVRRHAQILSGDVTIFLR